MFIVGIKKGEYKPNLYRVERSDVPVNCVVNADGEHVYITRVSSPFELDKKGIDGLIRFYGVNKVYDVIGEHIETEVIW